MALTLSGASGNTTTPGLVDSEGIWRVRLPPQAAGGPYSLRAVSASTGESAALADVLFGDVVICGGQSNMALGMGEINNSTALIAAAASRPGIRIMSPQYSAQNISQRQFVLEYAINWTSAANDNGAAVAGFSAVCYLTAANLYDALGGAVPFGLVDTAVGGTMISLWLSGAALDECLPLLPFVPSPPWTLSCWHNGMLSPLTAGPTDAAFALYDQGENDVGERAWYECAFPALIKSWRAELAQPALPFFFVQLPEYLRANDTALAELRQGQLAALALPATGVACTADNGDPLSKDTSIHTLDKMTVARRLAALALAGVYGRADVAHLSPRYASAAAAPPGPGRALTVTVRATAAYSGLTLVSPSPDGQHGNSSLCPAQWGVQPRSCDWFAVQDSTGAWLNATATIGADSSTIVLSATASADGATANATRNGYADWPVVSVYNSAGLPLIPWPPTKID
jgi:sialate O-acetylesterase